MKQYIDLLAHILENGSERDDRTGVGTIGVFGYQMRFDLRKYFPAVTTKKLAWKAMSSELLWFLEGSDDERRLAEIMYGKDRSELQDKTTIWTANANKQGKALGYADGILGPVYGVQWRKWKGEADTWYDCETSSGDIWHEEIDQIANLINGLKNDPFGRRHILSAWNVGELDKMALPPCHCFAQFYVNKDMELSCQLYQRSCDVFLGLPFNIASYALLTHMLAQVCGLKVGDFVWSGGDVHIYKNHVQQVQEQLLREPRELPTLWIDTSITDIDSFTMDSFRLEDYDPMDSIKAPMAV